MQATDDSRQQQDQYQKTGLNLFQGIIAYFVKSRL